MSRASLASGVAVPRARSRGSRLDGDHGSEWAWARPLEAHGWTVLDCGPFCHILLAKTNRKTSPVRVGSRHPCEGGAAMPIAQVSAEGRAVGGRCGYQVCGLGSGCCGHRGTSRPCHLLQFLPPASLGEESSFLSSVVKAGYTSAQRRCGLLSSEVHRKVRPASRKLSLSLPGTSRTP